MFLPRTQFKALGLQPNNRRHDDILALVLAATKETDGAMMTVSTMADLGWVLNKFRWLALHWNRYLLSRSATGGLLQDGYLSSRILLLQSVS